jgi:hypothetical protein
MQEYVEFPNLCFVDTLDSVEGLGKFSGYQGELFGALTEENHERIKRQNRKKISVVIGKARQNMIDRVNVVCQDAKLFVQDGYLLHQLGTLLTKPIDRVFVALSASPHLSNSSASNRTIALISDA